MAKPLGINTKSISPASIVEYRKIREVREIRYILQSNARKLFIKEGLKKGLEYPQNYHRTAKCYNTPIASKIGLNLSVEHRKAFFSGVGICGSVWSCPVCAAKVQERRRVEIALAMDKAYSSNYKCIMVTFTFPHLAFDKLSDLLKKQSQALSYLRGGKQWVAIKKEIGYKGLIRSLELTYGDNGWHPHTHEIWIVDKKCNAELLQEKIISRWEKSCIKFNLLSVEKLEGFRKHAVDLKDNATNSDYLAKQDNTNYWGADREVAKASSKSSKGMHPFELLVEFTEKASLKKRSYLWIEYAEGMKGKRQIFWSHGLKDWAGVNEKTDLEIAEENEEKAQILGYLEISQWRLIVKNTAHAEILYRAEIGGFSLVSDWFSKKLE